MQTSAGDDWLPLPSCPRLLADRLPADRVRVSREPHAHRLAPGCSHPLASKDPRILRDAGIVQGRRDHAAPASMTSAASSSSDCAPD
jgi:hypothetical protein